MKIIAVIFLLTVPNISECIKMYFAVKKEILRIGSVPIYTKLTLHRLWDDSDKDLELKDM